MPTLSGRAPCCVMKIRSHHSLRNLPRKMADRRRRVQRTRLDDSETAGSEGEEGWKEDGGSALSQSGDVGFHQSF